MSLRPPTAVAPPPLCVSAGLAALLLLSCSGGTSAVQPSNVAVEPQPSSASAVPTSDPRFEVSPVDDTVFALKSGSTAVNLRYVEKERVDEGANYPRVIADIDVELAPGEWTTLLSAYCHDSYDDCGAAYRDDLGDVDSSTLSCPVLEDRTLDGAALFALAARFGGSGSAARKALDAIGAATPLRLCLARLHRIEPYVVAQVLTDMGGRIPPAEFESLMALAESADVAWAQDRPKALSELTQLDERLAVLSTHDDSIVVELVFTARYFIDASVANAAGEYLTPLVGPGGQVVRWVAD